MNNDIAVLYSIDADLNEAIEKVAGDTGKKRAGQLVKPYIHQRK